VSGIRILVDVSKSTSQVQPYQVFSYGEEGKPALDVLNFKVPSPAGGEHTLSLQRNRDTGIVTVQVGPSEAVPELPPEGTSSDEKHGLVPTVPAQDVLTKQERPEKS
jgi:hypothetical protein